MANTLDRELATAEATREAVWKCLDTHGAVETLDAVADWLSHMGNQYHHHSSDHHAFHRIARTIRMVRNDNKVFLNHKADIRTK